MGQANRPLSPHLNVYRWQVTNTLSIVHRFTGVMLALGALAFTGWLLALAFGPDAYLAVLAVLDSPLGVLLLLGWTFCFSYHLCNGIRHLCWDAGYGFEMPQVRASGTAVVAAALLLTALLWALVLSGGS